MLLYERAAFVKPSLLLCRLFRKEVQFFFNNAAVQLFSPFFHFIFKIIKAAQLINPNYDFLPDKNHSLKGYWTASQ
jgi:hypothetical protein